MLYFLVLIEGYIGLAIQMLVIRQLTPSVGVSAVTSSWIIGFFLLALAIGYKKGGVKVDSPIRFLAKNFIKVGITAGLGVSSLAIMIFFDSLAFMSTIYGLVLYCAAIVSPIAYWMGQSLPLLIQEFKWGKNNSEISGNALYLSTIGSFLGAIITTNVFLFVIGATWTLTLVTVISLVIGLALINSRKWKAASVIGIVMSIATNIGFSNSFHMVSSPYADIFVFEDKETNEIDLVANSTIMSKLKNGKNDTWYIDQFNNYVKEESLIGHNFLILGAGGFVAHLEDDKNTYTYIDIDPELKKISEERFIKRKMDQEFIVSDARRYLIDDKSKRNLIFLDAFSSKRSIPSHLVTKEFFYLLRDRLNVGGKLVINVIMDSEFNTLYSQRFHSTVTSAFPFCKLANNASKDISLANVMYFCEKKQDKIELYSDDNNRNEFDFWRN